MLFACPIPNARNTVNVARPKNLKDRRNKARPPAI